MRTRRRSGKTLPSPHADKCTPDSGAAFQPPLAGSWADVFAAGVELRASLPLGANAAREPVAGRGGAVDTEPHAWTAFAGWGYFVFAWRGQWMATSSLPGRSQAGYWALVAAALGMLAGMRALLGAVLFSALVWIRFIGHFVKAQVVFAGRAAAVAGSWRRSYQPVFAFAWLSVVLFNVGHIQQHRWLLFGVCLLLGVTMLAAGGWRTLSGETHRLPAVARFFLGESLVWGTYGVIYDASLSSRCVRVSCGGRELLPLPGQLCVWAGEDRRPLAWVHADYCRKPLSNLYGPEGRIGLALARCPKDARFGVRHWVFYVMGGPAATCCRCGSA